MPLFVKAGNFLRNLFRFHRVEQDLDQEVHSHLQLLIDENIRAGMSPQEAQRAARIELGGAEQVKEEVREERLGNSLHSLMSDIRFGFRQLYKDPRFTAVAILVIALGVGANTAMFTIVNAVLLQPLPFPDPDRLIVLSELAPNTGERVSLSFPSFLDWRAQAKSFEAMAGYRGYAATLTGIEPPDRLTGRMVSAGFFEILGVKPILGRSINVDDDQPNAEPVVVLSYSCWQSHFGGDPRLIGRKLVLGDEPRIVIGILPPDFEFGRRSDDLFIPLVNAMGSNRTALDRGNHMGIFALARLKRDVSLEQARAEIKTIAGQLEKQYPLSNSGVGANAVSLYEQWVGGKVRAALLILFAAVSLVLLIACANVANLLLSRATARQKEMAIRTALGANRWRIIRQLLTESVLLSGFGGVLGLLLAVWGVGSILKTVPTGLPRFQDVHIDRLVLGFTLFLSGVTGIVFGLAPALESSRTNVNESLKAGSRNISSGRHRLRLRQLFLVSEVALALVLSIGAGLLIHTMLNLKQVNPGFETKNLLTFSIRLTNQYRTNPEQATFFKRAADQLRILPGVKNAATVGCLAIDGTCWGSVFLIEGRPIPERSKLPSSRWNVVGEQYFETMGIRLLQGRTFRDSDTDKSAAVVVINENAARRFFPNDDPIGRRVKQGWPESPTPWREIVGVVGDVKEDGLDSELVSEIYVPESQETWNQMFVVIRTVTDPVSLLPAARKTVRDLDKDLPVFSARTMDKLLYDSIASRRFSMILLGLFAALAFLLAAVGVYGVISYSVSQRKQEIGIRVALGAGPGQVVRLILREGMTVAAIGATAGLAMAIGVTRAMSSLLFGISSIDVPTYAIATGFLTLVALAASYGPATRATGIDPAVALRQE
jgi:predicted permease